ncbi:MAG: type II toxin-antitoxin system HicB family antitoxin [Thaumarchaeota archaeon]|nr:type II toxin-antitoxin system HicB family antitoxin [Nitrososphaerota archaeon]MCS4539445.1 type II toxin-antitoxin system HicB family antitoxin [Nitrososphaerota archaeon]
MNEVPVLRPRRKFHISIEKDEAGLYVGRCKELPNAFTQAKSLPKLKERMAEVISLIIEEIEEEHARNPKKIIEVVV